MSSMRPGHHAQEHSRGVLNRAKGKLEKASLKASKTAINKGSTEAQKRA